MRQIFVITFIGLTLITQAYGQTNSKVQTDDKAGKIYKNEMYRFSATIPSSWKLYGQIINDTINHVAIADWGLPKVYSELEQTEIENSISIIAYRRRDINSIDELIQFEWTRYKRNGPSNKIVLEVDKTSPDARIINITEPTGIKYRGKLYFVFQNGIGYVVTFMATPGTYEKNIKVFEEFYENVKLN